MAGQHEGYSLGIKVDLGELEKAQRLTTAFDSAMKKAGKSMSGLRMPSGVSHDIQHVSAVTASYITRLESEGKHYQANQEKVKVYRNSISDLTKKQHELESQLNDVAKASGKDSDAYRLQRIKINENATALARTRTRMSEVNSEMRKANPSAFDRIRSKLNSVNREGEKTHRTFKDVFMGSALGSAVVNALSNVGSQVKSIYKDGMQVNAVQGRINSRFKAMKLSSSAISSLDKQIKSLKYNTGMTGEQVSNLQTHMLTWSNIGRRGAMRMTKALSGIGDSSKLSGDQIEKLGQGIMRAGSAGKVTYSSLNRVTKAAPTFYTQLARGAHMSEGHLKALLQSGKVTQKQFQGWLAASSKYANSAFAGYGKTQGAALHRMQMSWMDLKGTMMKPLFSAKTSGLQAMSKLMESSELKSAAKAIGNGISAAIGAIYKHRADVSGVMKDFIKIGVELGKSLWKDFSAIFYDIAKSFGLVHGNAKKSGGALHSVRLAMDGIAKNQHSIQLISKAIIAMAAVKGFTSLTGGLQGIAKATNRVHAFRVGLGGLRDKETYKGVEGMFNSLGVGAGKLAGHLNTAAHSMANFMTSERGMAAGKAFGAIGTGLVAGQQGLQAIKERHSATKRSKDIGGGVGAVIGGAATSMIPVVGPWLAPVGAEIGKVFGRYGGQAVDQFTKGWQRHKAPKNKLSLANMGWSMHNFAKQANRNVNAFFKSLPKNTKKAENGIKSWASRTGKSIHSAWNNGIKSSHNFFKNLPRNFKNFRTSFGKNWNSFWNKTHKNARSSWNGTKKNWNGFWRALPGRWHNFRRNFGAGWNAMWRRTAKSVVASWNGTKRNWHNFWKYLPRNWNNFKKSFGAGWKSFWNSIFSFFRGIVRGIKSAWDNTIGGITKAMNHVKAFGNDVSYAFGGSRHTFHYSRVRGHAAGGTMRTTHGALVGEAGPELAYKPNAAARLLGAKGPQITKVRAGEHILNARDTAKVLNGGLGKGLTLKGYAAGTVGLGKSSKKVTQDYKNINTKSVRSLKDLSKKSNSTWKQISRQTTRQTTSTRKKSINDFTKMRKGVHSQMTSMKKGTISLGNQTAKGFGKAMDKMKGYSRNAMKDTIGQINRGIRGIDKVLGQFGGNNSVIKLVHFAKGSDSNGRLTRNTMAVVNDAKAGPVQESVVTENNDLIIPAGRNRPMMLKKGWGVLNGAQTQQVAQSYGLNHFAKGSGVSHSQLRKIAAAGGSNPAKSFDNMYNKNLQTHKPDIEVGTTSLAKNASTHFGVPWMNAMWTVINDAIGEGAGKGGTREAFLKYAEKTFTGVKYVMGAASHAASDCSGMVMQALRHFGIDIGRTTVAMQHSSGVQYLGKNINRTIPGDLVIYGHGTGAAGHVGIIKNPRTHSMFNETPPRARVSSVDAPKSMGYGFYRVRGLHNAKPTKKDTASKPLIALAKRELGPAAIKWIKKNLGDTLGSLGAFSMRGDIGSRARALAAGLMKLDPRATKNGIAAILGNWSFESTLNPGAVNPGGGASGLGQWLGGRLSNLKAYARRHGMSWKNPAAQLSFAVKGEGSDSAIFRHVLQGHASVESLANEFSSRWERGGYNAQHVAGARRIRKILGYANGGEPKVNDVVKVGEKGPELAQFKKPVHIYSNEESKKMSFGDLLGRSRRRRARTTPPTININLNGPISSTHEAHRVADIVKQQVTQIIENFFGDEEGTDPSVY